MTHEDDDVEHFQPADIEATIDDVERYLETGGVDPDNHQPTVIQAVLDEVHAWFTREVLPNTNIDTMDAADVQRSEALVVASELVVGPNGPRIVSSEQLGEAQKSYEVGQTASISNVFFQRAKRSDPTGTVGSSSVSMTVIE